MDKELWIAILTFGTAAVGAVRWLIHVYWKQAETIEDLRSRNERITISKLRDAIDDIKKEIATHNRKMTEINQAILKAQQRIEKNTTDTEALIKSVADYIETTAAKFKLMESQIVKLANDLIMVKGGVSGSKKN